MTTNLIHAFKITIYNTKHTNNATIHIGNSKNGENDDEGIKYVFLLYTKFP